MWKSGCGVWGCSQRSWGYVISHMTRCSSIMHACIKVFLHATESARACPSPLTVYRRSNTLDLYLYAYVIRLGFFESEMARHVIHTDVAIGHIPYV